MVPDRYVQGLLDRWRAKRLKLLLLELGMKLQCEVSRLGLYEVSGFFDRAVSLDLLTLNDLLDGSHEDFNDLALDAAPGPLPLNLRIHFKCFHADILN